MHACYYACMEVPQYTIRNIPQEVDNYLREQARLSGKSINQVVIDELSEKVAKPNETLLESLDWFIGSGIDQETLDALEEDDKAQKAMMFRELDKL